VVMSSPRRDEIVEAAYEYVLSNGLAGISLRPVAAATGSSTGVLRFLFGSKDELVRAVLARARRDELDVLDSMPAGDISAVARGLWTWLSAPDHRRLLALWVECYAASLQDPGGPWGQFAEQTVTDWLSLLARAQPAERRRSVSGAAERTAMLAILRGAMLDLLATGDVRRTTRAVEAALSP